MQYLYSGGCGSLNVIAPDDMLELMAAASFFQLDDLLRYTEARCSQIIDIENIVSTYIHAKVSYAINSHYSCPHLSTMYKFVFLDFLPGLRCIETLGILSRISAEKYGCIAHVQRVRQAIIVRQENSQSRRTERLASDPADSH